MSGYKKFIIGFTRQYEINIPKNQSEDEAIKIALDNFGCDISSGVVCADLDSFTAEVLDEFYENEFD